MARYDVHRKTDAATEPVTLEEVKKHLRVDWASDDAYISSIMKVARQRCEGYSNRAYITQTWVLKLTGFMGVISVPMPNLLSVTAFKCRKTDGSLITLTENTNFAIDKDVQPGIIYFPSWVAAPSISLAAGYPIEIEYTCGYGPDAASVPQYVKHAILLTVGHYYENRENTVIGQGVSAMSLPFGAEALLDMDRVVPV